MSRRHPGLGAEHSAGREFWSDANLDQRAVAADATDFALMPGENKHEAIANSGILASIAKSGGALPVLKLADIEVDEGFRSADLADDYLSGPSYSPPPQSYAPPAQDESALADRIAAMVMQRIEQSLGGQS